MEILVQTLWPIFLFYHQTRLLFLIDFLTHITVYKLDTICLKFLEPLLKLWAWHEKVLSEFM
jgi:hypothetical protein